MKFLFIIPVLFFILLFGCKGEKKEENKISASAANGINKPVVVDGIVAKAELTTNTISTSGSIIANEEVEIKSEVAGKITGIYFKEGQSVSKGQLLVKLNDDDLQAQIKKMQIEIKLAEEKENRQKQLLSSSAISKEEYDESLTNLSLLKANVEIIKIDVAKTKITAPFSGIAGFKYISPGAYINSSTVIATIQNTNPLKLEFAIPEKYNLAVKTGSLVNFKVAGSSENYKATVYAKDPKIDPMTRTVKIRATFPNVSGKLYPGSFADINIPIGDKSKEIFIPTMSYIPDINGAKVFVSRGGQAMSIPVTAGMRTASSIQILEGIKEGDTILTTGILQLKPKTPVKVNIVKKAE